MSGEKATPEGVFWKCAKRISLGCPQQAKRDVEGGEAVIRISEKDILIHYLPDGKENNGN